MSVFYRVDGIKLPDGRWLEMKAVYDACRKAEIEIPEEVSEYFNDQPPDPKGVLVRIDDNPVVCIPYKEEMVNGYEVDLTALDPTIKKIRFTVHY